MRTPRAQFLSWWSLRRSSPHPLALHVASRALPFQVPPWTAAGPTARVVTLTRSARSAACRLGLGKGCASLRNAFHRVCTQMLSHLGRAQRRTRLRFAQNSRATFHLELPTDLIRGFGELCQARPGDPQTLLGSFPPSQGACDRCLLPTIFKERVPIIMCVTRSWLPRDPVNQAFSRRSARFGPTSHEDSGVIFLASCIARGQNLLCPVASRFRNNPLSLRLLLRTVGRGCYAST